jgi:hypothetical protein
MRTPSSPVVIEFPFRGEWVAVRTSAHRILSHGTDQFGQRYAFGFVRPDHCRACAFDRPARLVPCCSARPHATTTGGGQSVYAAFDDQVKAAVVLTP